jgi:hypothetical protein
MGNSWVAVQLADSQEGLSSMELVSYTTDETISIASEVKVSEHFTSRYEVPYNGFIIHGLVEIRDG